MERRCRTGNIWITKEEGRKEKGKPGKGRERKEDGGQKWRTKSNNRIWSREENKKEGDGIKLQRGEKGKKKGWRNGWKGKMEKGKKGRNKKRKRWKGKDMNPQKDDVKKRDRREKRWRRFTSNKKKKKKKTGCMMSFLLHFVFMACSGALCLSVTSSLLLHQTYARQVLQLAFESESFYTGKNYFTPVKITLHC